MHSRSRRLFEKLLAAATPPPRVIFRQWWQTATHPPSRMSYNLDDGRFVIFHEPAEYDGRSA